MTKRAITYASYLGLEELLAAQRPASRGRDGEPEHDELLFIVIHQVYELWFKQLLHELTEVQRTLEGGDTDTTLHLLNRVLKILKTLVAQVDVLETMTPLQFLSFRDRLESASGFQSAQFREVEAVLGKREPGAVAAQPEGSTA
jgi:tryptophan 2,3-dioxygenase